MAFPDSIPVRYSEEEAGYVTFRPIVRQTFRPHELLDMVLSVTGKDPARVRQILHSGTLVFHFYRYWWEGFDVTDAELSDLLREFPDPDPARPFSARDCTLALAESDIAAATPRELSRSTLSHRRFLRRRSVWDVLVAAAAAGPLVYSGYSYAQHADLYRLAISAESRAQLVAAAAAVAPRSLQPDLRALAVAVTIVFVCPRGSSR